MVIIPIFLRTFAPSAKEMTACWCSSSWETEAVSIALFGLLLLATRLGSCSVVRRWQCFFDSVLFGQDVGESARGAARWAAPLHWNMTDYLAYLGKIILPMGAVRYPLFFKRITPKKCANYRLEPINYRYLSIIISTFYCYFCKYSIISFAVSSSSPVRSSTLNRCGSCSSLKNSWKGQSSMMA